MTENQKISELKRKYRKDRNDFISTVKGSLTIENLIGQWWIRQYITKSIQKKINEKKLSHSVLKSELIKRYKIRKAKELTKDIDLVKLIFAAGTINEIKVQIEWKTNRTWGANPTAEVWITGENFEYLKSGSIGGCGYDKTSTSFAQALNQSLAFRKLLLKNSNKIAKLYGHRNGTLSGGVGVSCYPSIFAAMGYKMQTTASGKMFDAYLITKKG